MIQNDSNVSLSIKNQLLSENALRIRAKIMLRIRANNKEIQRWILIFVLYNNLQNKKYHIQHKVIIHQTHIIFKNDKPSVQISEKFHNQDHIRTIHINRYIPLRILVNRDGW